VVDVPERLDVGAVLYASADQRSDLVRQVPRLSAFVAGIRVAKVVAEEGRGLNGHRKGLMAVLRFPEYRMILVEHLDRLARFGSEYLEAAWGAAGRWRLLVMELNAGRDDPVQDMLDVLASFCARLYGRRSARRRAERALACATEADSP